MSKSKYEIESVELIRIIEIAIKAFQKHSPTNWPLEQTNEFIKLYEEEKTSILNPKPQFKKVSALKQRKNNILIYFQESHGKTVHYFWEEITANNIVLERKNNIKKILKRKKILNVQEYDAVIDLMVPYYQDKIISKSELEDLKSSVKDFEMK